MKKGLFLLVIVVFSHCHNKYRFQKDMPPIPKHEWNEPECGWFGTMSVEDRRALFPFNEATKILLISYGDYEVKIVEPDSVTIENKAKTPILRTFNAFDNIYSAYEIVELSQQQIDSLSNLAFNYKMKGSFSVFTSTYKCYTPRNSILFFDKNDQLIFNLEVCFECHKIYLYPRKKDIEAFKIYCRSPELIKAFFKQNNVHYGVD